MPLLDHFHPPLSEKRSWESFHGGWAWEIMSLLNRGLLPKGYFAEAPMHIGGVEVDIATLQEPSPTVPFEDGNGGVAVQVEAPPTTFTIPAVFPDSLEVRVFETTAGPALVGAIEFVSPANKDRPDTRLAFAAKCAAYLQQGVGLMIVDVVTDRQCNLHDELIDLLDLEKAFRFPGAAWTYCTAYRPYKIKPADGQIEVRCFPLVIGKPLPHMPLSLRRGPTIMIDLEGTYTETRLRSQL